MELLHDLSCPRDLALNLRIKNFRSLITAFLLATNQKQTMAHPEHSSLIYAYEEATGEHHQFDQDFFHLMRKEKEPNSDHGMDIRYYGDVISVTRLFRAYLTSSSLSSTLEDAAEAEDAKVSDAGRRRRMPGRRRRMLR